MMSKCQDNPHEGSKVKSEHLNPHSQGGEE